MPGSDFRGVGVVTVCVKIASAMGAAGASAADTRAVMLYCTGRVVSRPFAYARPQAGLTVSTGLAGLSLDAMAAVSYGPETIVLVLAVAGSAGLGMTVPVTTAIAVLLVVLIASYRQVIAAFPDGGGAYAVAKRYLGVRTGLVAVASPIVDYVLNVAVSVAAGVAALTSAFPGLHGASVEICLVVTAGITVLNLFGIVHSARAFMAPMIVFVVGIFAVIIAGLFRGEPAAAPTGAAVAADVQTVGILLLLEAFSSGCAALTGVEAIANAVPGFAEPRVRRARRAEVTLGLLLGTMLLGPAVLIEKFEIHPIAGDTVLSQLTTAALGDGIGYYGSVRDNCAAGAGGEHLLRRTAHPDQTARRDNCLPHRFAVASPRRVYRYGVLTLGAGAAVLLVGSGGQMNALVPLFAIGVFAGFTIAQAGMVRHWWRHRGPRRRARLGLNGFGALLTAAAAGVTTAMKFGEGAWPIVVVLALLVVAMHALSPQSATATR